MTPSHCRSSLGSRSECRTVSDGCQPRFVMNWPSCVFITERGESVLRRNVWRWRDSVNWPSCLLNWPSCVFITERGESVLRRNVWRWRDSVNWPRCVLNWPNCMFISEREENVLRRNVRRWKDSVNVNVWNSWKLNEPKNWWESLCSNNSSSDN